MTRSRPARRRVLAGMLGAAALAVGLPVLPACTAQPSGPPEPDVLGPVAARAEADARHAAAVAVAHPDLAAAASALALDRGEHATALRGELARARPTSGPSAASTVRPPPDVASDRSGALRQLRTGLRAAQQQAAALVGSAPGHRAALLASIAACCASHAAVLP